MGFGFGFRFGLGRGDGGASPPTVLSWTGTWKSLIILVM